MDRINRCRLLQILASAILLLQQAVQAQIAPTITNQPHDLAVTLGGNATFTVEASGTLPLTYQWRRNGSNISGATNTSYSVLNVQLTDNGGKFSVVVSNAVASVTSSEATLTLGPTITNQPQNVAVTEGGNATFTVTAGGNPPLSYQWRRGGVIISGAVSTNYTVLNVQPADSGSQYSVVVSDLFSSATSSNATLTVIAVNDPPVRTNGVVTNLTVSEDSGLTSLGLGAVGYSPGPSDEGLQVLTNIVTAVPPPSLGQVVLAGGTTLVTANTRYTLGQLQGMQFRPAPDANGGPAVFSYLVQDNGGIANGGVDTLVESLTISVTAVNDAPTLSSVNPLSGAGEDTDFTISYATLAAAADEADVDGDLLSFRVEEVSSGTLTKGGLSVVSGMTLLGAGESLVWRAATNVNGTLNAFTVWAWDGTFHSTNPAVPVRVSVTAMNDTPSFRLVQEDGQPFVGTLRVPSSFLGERLIVINPDLPPADETNQVVAYSLVPTNANYASIQLDSATGRIRFTSLTNGFETNTFSLIATDSGGANSTNRITLEIAAEPVVEAPPLSYCVDPGSLTNALFTAVVRSSESMTYQWKVNGKTVPSLNHSALKLPQPQPDFSLSNVASVEIEVIVSNSHGSVTNRASVAASNDLPKIEFDPGDTRGPLGLLVVVTPGASTNLMASVDLLPGTFSVQWRHNGVPLFDRTNVVTGTQTTDLHLMNILPKSPSDPSVATNGQVGLYELFILRTNTCATDCTTNCTIVARFELEISSRITTTSAPHSLDNLEDFEPLTNVFPSLLRPGALFRPARNPAPRAGIGIVTIPRSKEFHYLSLFASTHQEHEAELFHDKGRTNGFSQWFVLRPENTYTNQLVTLDVSGSANLTNIVLAVYARTNASKPVSFTNLDLITRFDSFKDPTRRPSGGTNAVVTFVTRTNWPEFLVVVDLITNAPNMDVRLNWSADPFPGTNGFQWLKVLLPARFGRLDVTDSAPTSNVVYFAFASTNTNYVSLERLDTDWSAWLTSNTVSFECVNVGEVYLLTDPLPGRTNQITLTANNPTASLTDAGFQFVFRTNAVPEPATRIRIVQDGNSILLLWEGDGQVESAPTPAGPWIAIAPPLGTSQPLRLPANDSRCYYRLMPSRLAR